MLSCRSSCKVRTRKKSIRPRSPNPESCNSSLQKRADALPSEGFPLRLPDGNFYDPAGRAFLGLARVIVPVSIAVNKGRPPGDLWVWRPRADGWRQRDRRIHRPES